MPFGALVVPFGALIVPFGALVVPFGALVVPFGALVVPFGAFVVCLLVKIVACLYAATNKIGDTRTCTDMYVTLDVNSASPAAVLMQHASHAYADCTLCMFRS